MTTHTNSATRPRLGTVKRVVLLSLAVLGLAASAAVSFPAGSAEADGYTLCKGYPSAPRCRVE
jgi:hypothetical protein